MPQHLTRHVPRRLDADTPAPEVGRDTARAMRNVRVSGEGVQVVNGTVPVPALLGPGLSVVVGQATDPATNLVYTFRYVVAGTHSISVYDPATDTESIGIIWAGLGFGPDTIVQAGVIDGVLDWVDGVNPARQLPLGSLAAYQGAIAADPATDYLTVNRLPPLLPLTVGAFYDPMETGNRLLDASLQVTYRYEYVDGQFSVLAPWSRLIPMRTLAGPPAAPGTFDNSFFAQVPAGAGRPSLLVTAVHFYVRKGNDGAVYRYYTERDPAQFGSTDLWSVISTYDVLYEPLTADDATRPFDALPTGPPKARAGMKNRRFYANFTDGYASPTGLSLTVDAPVATGFVGDGARVWRGDEVEQLALVPYDAFGRNIGLLPETLVVVTIPTFDFSDSTANPVTQLVCTITATDPLPAWVARLDVVRIDKADTPLFTQGVGRLVFEYKPNAGGLPQALTSDGDSVFAPFVYFPLSGTNGNEYRVWVDVASLTPRMRGYTFTQGDRITLYVRDYLNPGQRRVASLPILEQRGDLLRIDLPGAARLDLLGDDSGAGGLADMFVHLNPPGPGGDLYYNTLLNTPALYGVVFEIYTPSALAATAFYEVAASVAVVNGAPVSTTLNLPGNVWLTAASAAPPQRNYPLIFGQGADQVVYSLDGGSYTAYNDQYWRWYYNTSPTDLYPTWETDRGRSQAELPSRLRQVRDLPTGIVFSGKILPETGINNLNVFEGTAIDVLPVEYGPVSVLVPASDAQERGAVLLALHTHQAESLQIEEAVLRSTDGSVVSTATSDEVIASKSLLGGGYGCTDPATVCERGGRVYYWCGEKGEWVRYAQNGLTPLGITYKMRSVLRQWQQAAATYGVDSGRLCGGYDGFAGEALLHLPRIRAKVDNVEIIAAPALTLAFSERQQGFTAYYDYDPELFIGLPDGLATAYRGQLHRHHGGAPARFYDVAYPAVVRVVAPTTQPSTPVLWQSVVVDSNAPWVPTLLRNERGQVSKVLRPLLKHDRDVWTAALEGWADTLALLTNARLKLGPRLRSMTLDVTLTLANEEMPTDAPARFDAVSVKGAQDVTALDQ